MSIKEILKKEYTVLAGCYEVFGVFLYGSQNYGLASDSSDIDTKAIVVPSFSDLVHGKPVSKTVSFEYGECDVKDIREIMNSYKKQNVNFIETLFTEYRFVAPKYEELYREIADRNEMIAHYDEHRALDCFNGLMMQAKKRLLHRTEKTEEEIEKYGYHRKSLMNISKYQKMAEKYISGEDYRTVLYSPECSVYRYEVMPAGEAVGLAESLDRKMHEAIESYQPKPVDEELGVWLDNWVEDVIRLYIRREK